MSVRPDIEAIRQRAAAAAPAPWRWRGNVDNHTIRLSAPNSRPESTVIDFVRWGMQQALPRLNVRGLMHRADEFAVFEVYPEATSRNHPRVYRGDIIGLRHPDADFMAHARQDIDDLLAYVAHMEGKP